MALFAVQVRYDFLRKPGGDSAIAKSFANRLKVLGHKVIMVSNAAELISSNANIFLAFNLDQPLELMALSAAAKSKGIKVALYPLYHPREGVRGYLKSLGFGLRKIIGIFSRNCPDRYFLYTSILRMVFRGNLIALQYIFFGRSTIAKNLNLITDYLLPTGLLELKEIKGNGYFLEELPIFIVPHPFELPTQEVIQSLGIPPSGGENKIFFIAGRIESRKNQLSIFSVADHFPEDQFIFAGNINPADKNYGSKFCKNLKFHPNLSWVGQLDFEALIRTIKSADAVISPSWFEVMSLINLFSWELGVSVISSSYTYDRELLGGHAIYYCPSSSNGLVDAIYEFKKMKKKSQAPLKIDGNYLSVDIWGGFDSWVSIAINDVRNK